MHYTVSIVQCRNLQMWGLVFTSFLLHFLLFGVCVSLQNITNLLAFCYILNIDRIVEKLGTAFSTGTSKVFFCVSATSHNVRACKFVGACSGDRPEHSPNPALVLSLV